MIISRERQADRQAAATPVVYAEFSVTVDGSFQVETVRRMIAQALDHAPGVTRVQTSLTFGVLPKDTTRRNRLA